VCSILTINHPVFVSFFIMSPVKKITDFVVNVDSINIFKSRLDKYWINQDIVFDYPADLAGTGDRSEYRNSY